MILRILGEGQLEVSDDALLELNELDEVLIQAVDKGDEAQFQTALTNLVNKVRAVGQAGGRRLHRPVGVHPPRCGRHARRGAGAALR